MAVVQGNVEVKVNVTGAGNASAVVDKTTESIKRAEKASDGVGKSLMGMRERMAQVVGIVDQGAGQMVGQLGAVGDLAANVSTKFGLWGIAAAGVVAGIAALVDALTGGEPTLTSFGQSMATGAKKAGDLAGAMTVVAGNAREAAKAIDALGKATVETYAKIAEARGDQSGAAKIRQAQGSVELDVSAAGAAGQVASTAGLLAAAQQASKVARDQIDIAYHNIEVAQLSHDKAAEAVARVALTQAKITKASAEQAIKDLTPVLKATRENAAALRAQADEAALQAGRLEGESFFSPDSPTDIKGPGNRGGTSGSSSAAEDRIRREQMKAAQDRLAADALIRGLSAKAAEREQRGRDAGEKEEEEKAREARMKRVAEIGALGRAFTDAIPGMEKFASTLSSIEGIWSKWAETGKDTKSAIVGSLGAIAIAGANEIKNQRLRAGVLSVIELGLGFANIENPMAAAAHFTAAAVLGGVAIFGGSSGGSRGSGGSSRAPRQVRSDNVTSGAVVININGSYYGAHTPQESAAGFARLISRADGTGFGARG